MGLGGEAVMAVCVSFGSVGAHMAMCCLNFTLGRWHMCVHGPVCVCVGMCVHCHGNLIKQLAGDFLFQVSVY